MLRRADGAVTQAWASLLNGDLDDAIPSRPPPPLGSLVAVAGPAPEIDWHASTADPAAREAIVDALAASATFREPVVLRGAADEWPAVCDAAKSWTLARLVADHGGFEGDVRVRQPEAAAAQGVRPDTFLYVEEVGGWSGGRDDAFATGPRVVYRRAKSAAIRDGSVLPSLARVATFRAKPSDRTRVYVP